MKLYYPTHFWNKFSSIVIYSISVRLTKKTTKPWLLYINLIYICHVDADFLNCEENIILTKLIIVQHQY